MEKLSTKNNFYFIKILTKIGGYLVETEQEKPSVEQLKLFGLLGEFTHIGKTRKKLMVG